MKVTKILCDTCGKEWPDQSPPSDEMYESGFIMIADSSVLLPEKAIDSRSGVTRGKSSSLDGVYCNYKCLFQRIREILKLTDREILDESMPLPPTGRKIVLKGSPEEGTPSPP